DQIVDGIRIIRLRPSCQVWARISAIRSQPSILHHLLLPAVFPRPPSPTLRYLPAIAEYIALCHPATIFSGDTALNVESAHAAALGRSASTTAISQNSNYSPAKLWPHKKASPQLGRSHWRQKPPTPLMRWAYARATAIVAVSNGVADYLSQVLG